MDDKALVRELNFLGIDRHTWPVLALLPLVQVAWADGEVQSAERDTILTFAREHYQLNAEGNRTLENWLAHPPTEQYLVRGREALHLLAQREPELAQVDDVISQAEIVARAAGGLFGYRSVDDRERAVLTDLVEALSVPPQSRWDWADSDNIEADDFMRDAAGEEIIEALEADESVDPIDTPVLVCDFHPVDEADQSGALLMRTDIPEKTLFPIPRGGMTIGRTRANDISVLGDPLMSRHHAQIRLEDGSWYLRDNQSQNGVWVHGERVTERRLFGDEELVIGSISFRFKS